MSAPARLYLIADTPPLAELRDRLSRLGYAVCGTATHGDPGPLGDDVRPDLILFDYRHRDATASTAVPSRLGDVPAVFLTARADEALRRRAAARTPPAYLVITDDDRELRDTLEEALHHRRVAEAVRAADGPLEAVIAALATQYREANECLQSIGDAVIAVDAARRITLMNPVAERLTGWTVAEARGQLAEDILPLHDEFTGAPIESPVTRVLETGNVHTLAAHACLRARDGRVVPIADSAAPLGSADGPTTGVVLVFRDVTQERRVEHERAQRLAFFAALNLITLELLARRTQQELLETIVSRSAPLFHAPHVDILLLEGDTLVSRARVGPAGASTGERTTRAQAPISWSVVDSRQPLVLEDYAAHVDRRAELEQHHCHAVAFYPINHGDRCLGVLCVARTTPGHTFAATEIAAAPLFAQLIALVLHQASSYEDAVRRADRSTDELHDSEERFAAMAAVVPAGLFRADAAGRIEYVNPRFCELAGLTADETLGDHWLRAVHPDDRTRLTHLRDRALKSLAPFHAQARYQRPDGSTGWFETDSVPWRDERGELRGYIGSVFDVTRRVQSETMLHVLGVEAAGLGVEAYLTLCVRRLAETLNASIVYVARFTGATPLVAETLAVCREGASAANFSYVVTGSPCDEIATGFDALAIPAGLRERYPENDFFRAQRLESYVGFPLHDHEGRLWGMLAVLDRRSLPDGGAHVVDLLRLVAGRVSADVERQRVEGQFNSLFEYAPDATLMTDGDGRIVLANRRMEQLFGYSRAELIGQPVEKLMPPEAMRQHAIRRAAYLSSPRPLPKHEYRHGLVGMRKDGSVFPADINLSPFGGAEGPLVVASVRDFTRQVLAEEALRQRDAILSAVTFAASRLLGAPAWREEMPEILARIGAAARASRAYLLELAPDMEYARALTRRMEWCADHVSALDAGVATSSDGAGATALVALEQAVVRGDRVVATSEGASAAERAILAELGLRSLALMPVFVGGQCWGALGLDQCDDDHAWSVAELDALSAAASAIGSALERERADAALRASEERLRMVVDHIGEGLIVGDVDGRVTYFNDRFAEIFGVARDAAGPLMIDDHVSPEHRALFRARHLQRMRGIPSPAQFEYRGVRANGDRMWIDVHVVEIRNADGRIVGTQSTIRDITARKNAELQVSEALATLDATVDAAYILDPKSLRFLYVNQGAVRTLGYSRAELLTMTAMDIHLTESETSLRTLIAPLMQDGATTRSIETRHRRKDGGAVPVEVTLQQVWLAEGSVRLIALARDISDRLSRQQTERRTQRLEAIGTLAGGIAHDLNNALTPVVMGLELLREQQPGKSKTVDQVAIGVERATDMVRQLLSFAKGAEGERTVVSPVRLVDEIHRLIASTFPKNIELHVRCDEDAPSVTGDLTQLHQVLLNLCVNARDALRYGGVLLLEASSIELDAVQARTLAGASPGHYLRLLVRDTGSGIPAILLDRIFDPFFTTKGADGGSGLGLSTALGIVKGHGGFIHVESEVDRGTTFEVYLPSREEHVRTGRVKVATPSAFRGRGETVLFVDDEHLVREMATIILERLNFTPITAIDGTDALLKLAEHGSRIFAVVTDLHMPRMDGLSFVRVLRHSQPNLPVAIASGRLDDQQAAALETLGVTTRLDKPFTQARLADALRRLLTH